MFGRSKTQQPAESTQPPVVKSGGKGRPTPSRKESEARNRRPLGGAPMVAPGASKAERKAARAAQRAASTAERSRTREALMTGDEAHLPARDRGPARRFVRDYVDARRNIGEYFLPIALLVLALSLVPSDSIKLSSVFLLYGVVLAVTVDAFLLRRKLQQLTQERFGTQAKGAANYGMMRALQLRRTRLPRPLVQRGQFPE